MRRMTWVAGALALAIAIGPTSQVRAQENAQITLSEARALAHYALSRGDT